MLPWAMGLWPITLSLAFHVPEGRAPAQIVLGLDENDLRSKKQRPRRDNPIFLNSIFALLFVGTVHDDPLMSGICDAHVRTRKTYLCPCALHARRRGNASLARARVDCCALVSDGLRLLCSLSSGWGVSRCSGSPWLVHVLLDLAVDGRTILVSLALSRPCERARCGNAALAQAGHRDALDYS